MSEAIIEALRNRAKRFFSLDTPANPDLGEVATDVAAGFVPGVGTALSARDFERSRREGDKLGMALAGAGMVPVAGGGVRAISKALRRAPRDEALEVARQNAVKMLGLPENNTAMDRARALGFESGLYHGTNAEEPISAMRVGKGTLGDVAYTTTNPNAAKNYPALHNMAIVRAGGEAKPVSIYPLMARKGEQLELSSLPIGGVDAKKVSEAGFDSIAYNHERGFIDPSRLRSRFAAFDPARVNENDLLGRADPRLLGLIAAGTATGATVAALRNKKEDEKKKKKSED